MKSHTSAGTRQQIAQSHVAKRTHRAEQKHQALDHDGSAVLLGVGPSTLLQVCRSTLLHFIKAAQKFVLFFWRESTRVWSMAQSMAEGPWTRVPIKASQLLPGKRAVVNGRAGRKIVLLRDTQGALSALDFFCYHHGGELGSGEMLDIEEVGSVLVCPAHGHRIHCKTGELLVHRDQNALNEASRNEANSCEAWASAGARQRVHPVSIDPLTDHILIQVSRAGALESDEYNVPAEAPAAPQAPAKPAGLHSEAGRFLGMPSSKTTPSRSLQSVPGSGLTTLAFQSRKRRATDAIKTKWAAPPPFSVPSPEPSPAAVVRSMGARPAPTRSAPSSAPGMQQATITSMFASAQDSPEPMCTS